MSWSTVSFAGIVPVAVLGLALAGCVDAPRVQTLAVQPSIAQLQAVRSVRANYVYYPDYEIYHSRNYQQYVYRYNHAWMIRATPPDLYADVLPTARFAPMSFHDDPWLHHAEVVRNFPRNQRPANTDLASSR